MVEGPSEKHWESLLQCMQRKGPFQSSIMAQYAMSFCHCSLTTLLLLLLLLGLLSDYFCNHTINYFNRMLISVLMHIYFVI